MDSQSETFVNESLDHLFRHHSGQMVSVLARIFGLENLEMIEDAIQDALISALKQWAYTGIPNNPRAWLIEVSKNRILDHLRRRRKFESPGEDLETAVNQLQTLDPYDSIRFANEVNEDVLRMMFACCHSSIPPDSQVALTLKIVSGFSAAEIARAFLAREEAVAKMIVRAKQKLRKHRLEMPAPSKIRARLDSVLKVLYLMFNEGYSAFEGEELVRKDLCYEAIRLCELLTGHRVTKTPKTHALAALFLFQGARLGSRQDGEGGLLPLSDQDRSLWDKKMLGRALYHFRLSAAGAEISDYHLEAEIASLYALAENFEAIDWPRILDCYELLEKRKSSPVAALNKIIVLAKIDGAEKALLELDRLEFDQKLKDYCQFYVTKAGLLSETGQIAEAMDSYKKAIRLTQNKPIRRFLTKKIEKMESESNPAIKK